MECPNCGAGNQEGNYCAECGAALDLTCPECGAEATPGAHYCTACGSGLSAGAGGGGRGSRAAWIIAAASLIVVVLVLFLPRQAERIPAPAAPGEGGLGALSPDMRTNADRLFNRIMVAAEQGDHAEVVRFMPMAVQAYEMVEDLDHDGLYHLSILHMTAGDHAAAREAAERILADNPDHILALGVAATAAEGQGEPEAARAFWQRLLDGYAEESDRPRPEYRDHERMLTEYARTARESTGSS